MIFIPLCQCSLKSSLFSKRRLGQDPTNAKGRLKTPNGVFRRPPPNNLSVSFPPIAFNKIAHKDSDFYVICTLPDFCWAPPPAPYVTHPSPSRSSPTWASPKTYASTASPPLSLRLVKPTAPPAMNPPCPAARAYFPAPPPNPPGR